MYKRQPDLLNLSINDWNFLTWSEFQHEWGSAYTGVEQLWVSVCSRATGEQNRNYFVWTFGSESVLLLICCQVYFWNRGTQRTSVGNYQHLERDVLTSLLCNVSTWFWLESWFRYQQPQKSFFSFKQYVQLYKLKVQSNNKKKKKNKGRFTLSEKAADPWHISWAISVENYSSWSLKRLFPHWPL